MRCLFILSRGGHTSGSTATGVAGTVRGPKALQPKRLPAVEEFRFNVAFRVELRPTSNVKAALRVECRQQCDAVRKGRTTCRGSI